MTPKTPTPNPASTKEKQPFDAEEVRAAALARELEGVRNINEVIEGVISTLERAKGNMGVGIHLFILLRQIAAPTSIHANHSKNSPSPKQ